MDNMENQEQKKSFLALWLEKPLIRATALILAVAMIFGFVGHGIQMHVLNRAYAKEEESREQQEQAIQQKQADYEKAYSLAAEAAESGDYAEALKHVEECLQYVRSGSEQEMDLLTTRASLNILLGNNEQALPDLQRVTAASPEAQDVLLLKSQTELGARNYEQAAEDMAAYLKKNPQDYDVRMSLTQLYEALEMNQEAADSYDVLLKLNPQDGLLQINAARAQILAGRIPRAQEILNGILEGGDEGQKKTARFLMALSYMQEEDLDNAIESFEQAAAMGYEPTLCLEQVAACAFVMGDYSKVMEVDRRLAGSAYENSQDPGFYQQVGVAALAVNNIPLAIQKLDMSLQLDPKYAGSAYYRALCRFSQKQWALAAEDFTAAIDQGYLTQSSYYNRGLCYAQLLDYNKSISDMERTVTEGDDQELIASASQLIPSLQQAIDEKK